MEQLVDNRYRVVKPLGSGGMAEVYLAHDDVLGRDVALKVMSGRYADDGDFVERFKREAQSAAALSHPNIVSIYDRGVAEDGTYYIAMECLPGGTLKDRILKRGALPPRTATAVALQIAEALSAAHRAGVVHRDIKPHNVLITDGGDIKVGDFGIARAASSDTMTKTGLILGTAHYISPEQAMGEPVGPASDLYSLGIVLYEMLTGNLPYDAETSIGIAMKHVNGYLVPPREVDPGVPEGINAVTTKLLAKNPDERYTSADELIKDLERVLDGREPAAMEATHVMNRVAPAVQTRTAPTAPPPSGKRRRRRWPWVLLPLLLLLALLAGAAYSLGLVPEMAPETQVPNLVGYASTEEAREAAGEDFEVAERKRVESREPVGTIVEQNPEAGEPAKEGSTIYVDVSGTQVADLPNVEGQTRGEAVRTLEGAGFEVEEKTAESSEQEKNIVTEQNPQGGGTAEVGSTVTITVGTGPETVEVPELAGNTPAQAETILAEAGLKLGSESTAPSDTVQKGAIISQNPQAGSEVEPGSSVDVTVSSGPERRPVPDVVGKSVEEAQEILWNAYFGSTVETVQSSRPAGTVVSTDPKAGTLLDPYSRNVTIRQSSGPPPQQPSTTKSTEKDEEKDSDKSKSKSKSKEDEDE